MMMLARILGVALLTGVLVAVLVLAALLPLATPDTPPAFVVIPALFLACVGGVIGAVAGAAREIVAAQRPKLSKWTDID